MRLVHGETLQDFLSETFGVRPEGGLRVAPTRRDCREGNNHNQSKSGFHEFQIAYATSSPRMVPVLVAKLSASMSRRCNMETKRFGSG